jgi:hypothetical protein
VMRLLSAPSLIAREPLVSTISQPVIRRFTATPGGCLVTRNRRSGVV